MGVYAVGEAVLMEDGNHGPSPGVHDLETAIQNYIDGQESGAYRKTADHVLRNWRGWLADRGTDSFEALNRDDSGPRTMRRYAEYLKRRSNAENGIAASTAHRNYETVRGFLTWCVRDGLLDTNPAAKETAESQLPTNPGSKEQQFWDSDDRRAILSYVDERAREAIDEDPSDAAEEARDRALVAVLAYTGVRGAEVFRTTNDTRRGRQGIRWSNVILDEDRLRVRGKSGDWEDARLPKQAKRPLEQWKRVQDPPSDDWPVFPTGHAPSKYDAVRDAVDGDLEDELEERDIDELLRDYDVAPPAITTQGARSMMKRLCEAAELDVDGGYLKPHGARRGIGELLYKRDRGEAQDHLRHQDQSTTREAYAHVDATEGAETASRMIEDEEGR